jgi:thioredoxin 1
MMDSLLIRSLLTLAICTSGIACYWLLNQWLLIRMRSKLQGSTLKVSPGLPSILYFTTPDCAPCHTVQRPAIQRLQEKIGDQLQVIEVDASDQPDLASQWGILSVPTTIVLDAQGMPRYVNHGVALTQKLYQQILEIS